MYIAQPGDILLYRHAPNFDTRLIKLGEMLEDGFQRRFYYHVAIAINANQKIEADGKSVAIHPIDFANFDVFRPPIPSARRDWALAFAKTLEKQPYDWPLIIDDGIRYLTSWVPKWLGGPWHLPVVYVSNSERIKKICSSLVVRYFNKAKWGPKLTANASPEDIYLAVRNYAVGG